ncbi:hypothetical protein C8J57DRAFT_1582318 [Mycena rebaudengoi]|nr:hypothetical protein C8J57DRAFT_1582318 [Mycena rebaudengoi]
MTFRGREGKGRDNSEQINGAVMRKRGGDTDDSDAQETVSKKLMGNHQVEMSTRLAAFSAAALSSCVHHVLRASPILPFPSLLIPLSFRSFNPVIPLYTRLLVLPLLSFLPTPLPVHPFPTRPCFTLSSLFLRRTPSSPAHSFPTSSPVFPYSSSLSLPRRAFHSLPSHPFGLSSVAPRTVFSYLPYPFHPLTPSLHIPVVLPVRPLLTPVFSVPHLYHQSRIVSITQSFPPCRFLLLPPPTSHPVGRAHAPSPPSPSSSLYHVPSFRRTPALFALRALPSFRYLFCSSCSTPPFISHPPPPPPPTVLAHALVHRLLFLVSTPTPFASPRFARFLERARPSLPFALYASHTRPSFVSFSFLSTPSPSSSYRIASPSYPPPFPAPAYILSPPALPLPASSHPALLPSAPSFTFAPSLSVLSQTLLTPTPQLPP